MTDLPLTQKEIDAFVTDGTIEEHTHDRLFEHFASNGEMPYGTMKARDGDPYLWIADRLAQEFSTQH